MPETQIKPIDPGGIMSYDLGRPARYYLNNIARNPLIMGLMQGAGGYLLGKYVGDPLFEALNPARSEKLRERRRSILPWLGAAAGIAPAGIMMMGRRAGDRSLGFTEALTKPFAFGKQGEAPIEKKSTFYAQPGVQNLIMANTVLSPYEKAVAFNAVSQAAVEQSNSNTGMLTTGDLVRGAIGAGMGYLGAKLFGKLLGIGFSMPPRRQKLLNRAGILGGILTNTGILRV